MRRVRFLLTRQWKCSTSEVSSTSIASGASAASGAFSDRSGMTIDCTREDAYGAVVVAAGLVVAGAVGSAVTDVVAEVVAGLGAATNGGNAGAEAAPACVVGSVAACAISTG